tara:strand:+ start:940 stop:1059 length:120 start_codon:yes stop_codon:yes gene_type:complete
MKLFILLLALSTTAVFAHPELHVHDHDGENRAESTLLDK